MFGIGIPEILILILIVGIGIGIIKTFTKTFRHTARKRVLECSTSDIPSQTTNKEASVSSDTLSQMVNKGASDQEKHTQIKTEENASVLQEFDTFQTTSAEQATKVLFEQALLSVPISDLASIEREFFENFKNSWRSRGLIKGTKNDLWKLVLSNLERTTREVGFQYFTVSAGKTWDKKDACILAWSDGQGASVSLWRTADNLYLCGNYYFREFSKNSS